MTKQHAGEPDWLALESVLPLSRASAMTSLSRDALIRNFPDLVVRVSPARLGMKLKHILKIADGSALGQRP